MIPRTLRAAFKTVSVLMLASIFAVACTKPEPMRFDLDTTPLLSGGLGWAVVSSAFVRLKDDPGFEARDGDYARQGAILRVVATERLFSGRNHGTWYKLEGEDAAGWLHQSVLAVYPSLERARNASNSVLQDTSQTASRNSSQSANWTTP